MIYDIIIPALGATGSDMVLEEWRVQPGQQVKSGSALFVVTTDKATVEVEAFRDGYLRETLASPGETVSVQMVIGRMTDTLEEPLENGQIPAVGGMKKVSVPTGELLKAQDNRPQRRLSSPLARRMASELGLDLASIKATGSNGQILKRDIMRSAQELAVESGVRHVPLSQMRRAVAQRSQRSNAEVPHFHGSILIDMTEAIAMLHQAAMIAERNDWVKPTITDICLRATALALRQVPDLNASFRGDEIVYFDDIHLGLVIGLSEGMLIPVLRHADRLQLFPLAAATHRLRLDAKNGQLSSSQMTGATFTVSNLGMYELDSFTAVINPPEAGILSLGAAKEQPAAWNGNIALRWQMVATLTVDHRVVDGITLAKFLQKLKQYLENPLSLNLETSQEDIK